MLLLIFIPYFICQFRLIQSFSETALSTFKPYQIQLPAFYPQYNANVRNIIIEPVYDNSLLMHNQINVLKNRFNIASFYFLKVLKVQQISDVSQTIYPDVQCDGYNIPQSYRAQGFDPSLRDMIIFLFNSSSVDNQNKSIACAVERRPIYGIISFSQIQKGVQQKDYHQQVYGLIHGLIHILGFHSVYFLETPLASELNLSMSIDQSQTYFYKNTSTSVRLTRKQVIMQNPVQSRNDTFMIITSYVKAYVQSFFGCSDQNIGAILQKKVSNQLYPDLDQYDFLFSHWDAQTFNRQLMSVWKYIYSQQRVSKLSLAFLKDTGFYENVDYDFSQVFEYSYTFDGCSFAYKNHTNNMCQYLKDNPTCDYYQSTYKFSNECTDLSQAYKEVSCYDQSIQSKCFLTTSGNAQCFSTSCLVDQSLYVTLNNRVQHLCEEDDINFYLHDLGYQIKCPQNKDQFCSTQLCPNWCNKKGLCIKGRCIYTQAKLTQKISDYIGDQSYLGYCEVNDYWYFCPVGCIDCTCSKDSSDNTTIIYDCNEYLPGFLQKISTGSDFSPKQCISGCDSCNYIDQITQFNSSNNKCIDCRLGFFNFEVDSIGLSYCYECDSNCVECQSTFQCRNQCTDCLQGCYLSADNDCQACQTENCLTCNSGQQCQKCMNGYFLSTDKDTCLQCSTSCGVCQDRIDKCIDCSPGFFKSDNQCYPCPDYCQICSSATTCFACFSGYFFNAQNQCVIKCEIPCLTCGSTNSSQCLSCLDGYKFSLEINQCIPLIDCSELSSDQKCQFCPLGYTTGKQTNQPLGSCSQAKTKNCAFDSKGNCISCLKGYYRVDSSYLSCSKCPQGCSSCTQSYCYGCSQGYTHPISMDGTFIKSKCTSCTHNCAICPNAPNQCLSCKDGYTKIGWKCVASVFVNYTLVFPDLEYQEFIENQIYRKIVDQIKNELSSVNFQSHTILNIKSGSVIFSGLFAVQQYQEASSDQSDCYIYNIIQNYFLQNTQISGYTVSSYQIVSSNQLCSLQSTSNQESTLNVVIIVIACVCFILIIIIAIMCIIYLRTKRKMKTIVLKYEEILSKPQYQSNSVLQRQAF